MKIAIARSPYQWGGIFRRYSELCSYCVNRHEVIGLMPFARENTVIAQPIRTFGYACHYVVAAELFSAQSIHEIIKVFEPLINRIFQDLESEQPSKVLAVDTDLKGLVIIAACKRIGIPVTTFVASVTSRVEAYGKRPCPAFVPLVERYCLEQSDKLIFPSRFAATYCSERYPKMAPFKVIYNGIASAFFAFDGLLRRTRTFGAVMRLTGIKNPDMLALIAAELAEHNCDIELVTVLGKSFLMPKGFDRIRTLAPISLAENLAQFYGSCAAIVCPSKFEASGNVPMESIATGTPAVITDQMGIAELFYDLDLAHLVVKVNDMKTTVDRLLHAEPITRKTREVLRENFAWPRVCSEIIAAL